MTLDIILNEANELYYRYTTTNDLYYQMLWFLKMQELRELNAPIAESVS